ncbi:MAG: hydrogenase maturation nickel metallochaperone HypA/HybF [Planctomycetota bacterium]
MHETMVAQSLFATISDEAAKNNAKPVGVKISCGMLNPINDEILRFAFEAIAKDTPCEGVKLQIEHKPTSMSSFRIQSARSAAVKILNCSPMRPCYWKK